MAVMKCQFYDFYNLVKLIYFKLVYIEGILTDFWEMQALKSVKLVYVICIF